MADITEILAQAKPPETTVELCLRGDLAAQFQDLERQLQDAPLSGDSLAEESPRRVIAEQMQALRQQMLDSQIVVRMRAVSALEWSSIAAGKPAEHGQDEDDEAFGKRWYDWVARVVSRSIVEVTQAGEKVADGLTVEQLGDLVDKLSGRQWDDLGNAAWGLNEQRIAIPFSAAASALTRYDEPR